MLAIPLPQRAIIAALISIHAASCRPQPTPAPGPVPVQESSNVWKKELLTILYHADTSVMKEEARILVRSDAQWQQTWANVVRNPEQVPPTKIDFRTHMVFVAALGSLNQGSPGIQLDSIVEYKDFVVMHTSVWRGLACKTDELDIHHVVTLVKMPNTYKPVIFTDTPKVLSKDECGRAG